MLKKILMPHLTREEAAEIFSAFDQIGGIIIIRIPDGLLHKRRLIGRTLLDRIKAAESVYLQSSDVTGELRTRRLELLAGKDSTKTEYREHGCRFAVDVREAFFSPRLSTERIRIGRLVQDSERVLNMFGGIGMFSIVAAKTRRCAVVNIDINPAAIDLCRANVEMNRLMGEVSPVLGDAAAESAKFKPNTFDRTLMLLPERSGEFLDAALRVTRPGGTIHFYAHTSCAKKLDAPGEAESCLGRICGQAHTITRSGIVRAVGPRYYQTVVDVELRVGPDR